MRVDERFIHGLELFNEGEFFECHEVIEDLWLETSSDDPYRDLYKGVIQAAAAIYQFKREIYSGALGLYRTSMFYLEKYEPSSLGLDVQKLRIELARCFKSLIDEGGKGGVHFLRETAPVLKFEVNE